MHLCVVLGNWLNVTVPILLFSCDFSHFPYFLTILVSSHCPVLSIGTGERLSKVHRVDLRSQEWNLRLDVHSAFDIIDDLELVSGILI